MAFNVTWDAFAEPNVTGFYDGFLYYNSVTENMFSNSLVIGLYVMFLMIFSKWGMKNAFAAASFIMLIISSILAATGTINDLFFVFFGIATAFSVILMGNR